MHNHVNTLKIENYSWGMKIAEMANRSLHMRGFVQVSNPCVVLPKFNNWQSQQQEYLLARRNCQLLDALFLKTTKICSSLSLSLSIQCRQGKVLLNTQSDYKIDFISHFHLIYSIFIDIWFSWFKKKFRHKNAWWSIIF